MNGASSRHMVAIGCQSGAESVAQQDARADALTRAT